MRTIMHEVRFVFPVALALASCAHDRVPREQTPAAPPAERVVSADSRVPAGWTRYVVRRGDTLGQIARCRGARTDDLAHANGIGDPDRISAGAPLHVPARDRCAGRATVARAKTAPAPRAQEATPKRTAATKGAKAAAGPAVSAAPPAPADAAPAVATAPPPDTAKVPPATRGASPALEAARATLDTATARYQSADFEGAIAGAEAANRLLESAPRDAESDGLRARSHALVAMAALGLEQHERALAELRTAFAFDPKLEFDPATTSPRIVELAKEVRSAPAAR